MEHHMGHLETMMSPLKHERRLAVSDAASAEVHQLVVVKHASVFVNTGTEATRILNEIVTKGPIYATYRLFAKQADLFASDEQDWQARFDLMGDALNSIVMPNEGAITADFLKAMNKASESGEPMDMSKALTLLGFDTVCEAVFGFKLGGVSGSKQGEKLYQALMTLAEKQSAEGMYANPDARKVTPEEEADAKADWGAFIKKCLNSLMTEVDSNGKGKHLAYGRALRDYAEGTAKAGDGCTQKDAAQNIMLAEVHQVLRHGHEAIGGMLTWLTVVLHQWPQVRQDLETALSKPAGRGSSRGSSSNSNEYVECVIKETLRRYPVCGNMTVRTVDQEGFVMKGGYPVPVGTPIFLHMFSLQNSGREWHKPKEFMPERWAAANAKREGENDSQKQVPLAPRCPFAASSNNSAQASLKATKTFADTDSDYGGMGHSEGSISFLPFGAGNRTCAGRHLALQTMRAFLREVASSYRMEPAEQKPMEVDPGASAFATIVPLMKQSTTLLVSRIPDGDLGTDYRVVRKAIRATAAGGGGWADASDDEDE
jgi:cytochrome P450